LSELIDCIEGKGIKEIKRLFFVINSINLCKLPYPGHKNGCPNVGKSQQCPPNSIRLEKKYNLSAHCYFVYIKFNIEKQEKRMLKLHPKWTKKQARCLLFWQPSIKKILEEMCQDIILQLGSSGVDQKGNFYTNTGEEKHLCYELIPEAMGLHVFTTAHNIGIPSKRNYSKQTYIYKIAFIGELNAINID